MTIHALILSATAAFALTTATSFADPTHSETQLGERHVNYAAAQWRALPAVPSVAADDDANHNSCPVQCG